MFCLLPSREDAAARGGSCREGARLPEAWGTVRTGKASGYGNNDGENDSRSKRGGVLETTAKGSSGAMGGYWRGVIRKGMGGVGVEVVGVDGLWPMSVEFHR